MEINYKEALRHIRMSSKKPSESFQTPWLYPGVSAQTLPVQSEIIAVKAPIKSEKSEVLEALTEFSSDKLESSESFKFEGGEIKRKENSPHSETIQAANGLEELLSKVEKLLKPELFKARFSNKVYQSGCRVLFVTDVYNDHNTAQSELTSFFDDDVATLFGKMISAMGLGDNDFYVSAIKSPEHSDEESRNIVMDEVFNLAPKFVVTLGATATNSFLGDQQRLKNIHGKLFDYSLTNQSDDLVEFKVMPLFSPKLLHTAPNMKKTAWKDMQILMELL